MIRTFRNRDRNRAGGLRWFAAEFLVVVTGVLVALALGGWWQDREERERETEYLQQLLADLERSEQALREISEFHADAWQAAARVGDAFWSPPDELTDELLADLMAPRRSQRTRPIMGTIDALIATGDLRLVRSDRLRAELVAYSEVAEATIENIQRFDETYYRVGQRDLRQELDYRAVSWLAQRVDEASDGSNQGVDETARPPFPVMAEDLFSNRRIYSAYTNLSVAHRNQAFNYAALMARARRLRGQVNRVLAGTLDPGNCQLNATHDSYAGACGDPEEPGREFRIRLSEAPTEPGQTRSFIGERIDATGAVQEIHLNADELGNGRMEFAGGSYELTGGMLRVDRFSFRLHVLADSGNPTNGDS